MQKTDVAIIDIGSSKISSFVGEKGVNKTFIIKGYKEMEYSGFLSGEFLDVKETVSVIKQMANNLLTNARAIKKVYVGVPGSFTRTIIRDGQLSFDKKRKITAKEINMLYDAGLNESIHGSKVINRSPILYELDDFRKTPTVYGEYSSTLKGRMSYVLCSDYFTKIVSDAISGLGIPEVEFVSVALAEALYLINDESRDRLAILVDVGYITSTFAIIQGDGILYQRSFDFGGGMITASLSETFDIDFEVAEKLKRKATISVTNGETDSYEIISGDEGLYFNKNTVKEIILRSIDTLAEEIDNCLTNSRINVPDYAHILVTGGGISYLRGAKERLSNMLNKVVETVAPALPFMDKPINSSYLSILNLALDE